MIIAIDTQFAAVAEPIVLGGLLVGLVWVTWHDLKSRRIPNVATYTMVLAGLIWEEFATSFRIRSSLVIRFRKHSRDARHALQ